VNPLTVDVSIYRRFDFENPPVGVKFLFDKPEGIERLDKKVPFCGMIGEAQKRGTPFYADLDSHGCPPGTHVLGCDLPKAIEAGYLGPELKIFREPMFNRRALASEVRRRDGQLYCLYAARATEVHAGPSCHPHGQYRAG
jgi:hypothetical protein